MENDYNNIVGIRIKQMRLNKEWTQKDLANKLGLKNDTAVANYESGYSIPKDDIKFKLCQIFDCSMDYLMGKSNLNFSFNDYLDMAKKAILDEVILEYLKYFHSIHLSDTLIRDMCNNIILAFVNQSMPTEEGIKKIAQNLSDFSNNIPSNEINTFENVLYKIMYDFVHFYLNINLFFPRYYFTT